MDEMDKFEWEVPEASRKQKKTEHEHEHEHLTSEFWLVRSNPSD